MDGLKARLRSRLLYSLQFKLSFYLAGTSLTVALLAGAVSFTLALRNAHQLQDDMLKQMAVLAVLTPVPVGHEGFSHLSPPDGDEETRVTVQWLSKQVSGELPVPPGLTDGLHSLVIDGEDYRIAVRTAENGARVAVAQEAGMRNEIARGSSLLTIAPILFLAPLLVLIVLWTVRRIMQPVARLSEEVNTRTEQALHAIDDRGVPSELRSFLQAINGLLTRVDASMAAQRRFVADAAHELRSPLAALSLQAERLGLADMSDTAHERLLLVREGISRGRHLLEQLLTLARAQADVPNRPEIVSLNMIVRRLIEEFVLLADSKNIDLGMDESDDVALEVDAVALHTLIKNLVDNAIRYSPNGGKVDLRIQCAGETIELMVRDDGPGIAPSEYQRVFDPFYRVLGTEQDGSGLGLAIVREMANRIGASLSLGYSDADLAKGLTVIVTLPRKC